MKNLITKLTIVVAFLITLSTFAQQGINYKAIIKDGSGNVVANQLIVVQFSILKGVAETNVYQEQHTPITDTNGLVVLNIGQGTLISGDFIAIDWASDYHSLNVQVNTGSGLVDLGTTQFMAVPYALSAANVTGLENLDEGGGSGWRLKGRNPANYGNIGLDAVDLSLSLDASTINGATGYASTAFGNFTKAESVFSTAIGSNNIGGGNAGSWVATDPLFEVGNSNNSASPSNAFTILKNGNVGIDIANPTAKFQITNGGDVTPTNGQGYIVLGNTTGTNLALDSNEIMARNNGSTSPLYLQLDGGNVVLGEGELQKTTTGNANLLPLAYGRVNADGTIIGGTGNFTINKVVTTFGFAYQITISGQGANILSSNSIIFLQPNGYSIPKYFFIAQDGSQIINAYFDNGANDIETNFNFIVYMF